MANQDDGLFLLEVLVDKIIYSKSPCFSDKAFRTCVSVKCLACDPLVLCEDDTGASSGLNDSPFMKSFNSGKSCLFSLKQSDISSAMNKFEIKVFVYKELPCGCLPTKINLGEATIDMTKEFVQARKSFLAEPNNVSYQALKDSFHIKGSDGVETGEILMFLRISCFGKLIVTKFRGSGGPPGLGSGMGGPGIEDRSCNPPRKSHSPGDPCACGAARAAGGGSAAGSSRGGVGGVCDPARDPYYSMPCEDPDDPCYCTGPKPDPKQQMACRNTQQYCLHVPKDCCPPGNKVVFQMPQDSCALNHKQRTHFNLTSDGVGDMTREDPMQLMSTTANDYPGVVYDFSNRVIKMKIGKTVEGLGRKSKLEYQFITPIPQYEKAVPINDNRGAQCVPARRCCSPCCSRCPK
ncbi:uncharacterized protein LOC134805327 isoform X2 [Cydia splendana]|uniref:uncharacterized protein LOC134805327 isoform X2 n=1 Tax=Cydia splendana TaxID=1100963 RepID=UPI00300C4293